MAVMQDDLIKNTSVLKSELRIRDYDVDYFISSLRICFANLAALRGKSRFHDGGPGTQRKTISEFFEKPQISK